MRSLPRVPGLGHHLPLVLGDVIKGWLFAFGGDDGAVFLNDLWGLRLADTANSSVPSQDDFDDFGDDYDGGDDDATVRPFPSSPAPRPKAGYMRLITGCLIFKSDSAVDDTATGDRLEGAKISSWPHSRSGTRFAYLPVAFPVWIFLTCLVTRCRYGGACARGGAEEAPCLPAGHLDLGARNFVDARR